MIDLRSFATITLLCLAALPSMAEAPPPPVSQPTTALQSSPVRIANRFIIDLRGPIAGYSAPDRARSTMERIAKTLESVPDRAITFQEAEEGKATLVLLAGRPAFLVTGVDINAQAGETTQNVAREAAKRLDIAVREWEEQREPRYLLVAAAFAAGATLLFVGLLWLVVRGNRWFGERLSTAAAAHSQKLQVGGASLFDASHVLILTRRTLSFLCALLALALASAWLTAVLELFPYTRPWGEELNGNLLELAKGIALAIVDALPGLLLVALIVFLARGVIRLAAVFFDRVAEGRARVDWLDTDTVRPTRRIFNFVVVVFAMAMAYPYLPGSGTEAFKGLSVLVGLMISLGGASVIGQAFSGLVLMYAKAFRAGDYVRVGDVEGTVMEIGLFATRLRTGMGAEVTLPNSGIMSTNVQNYSRAVPGTGYVVDTVVTIGYGTPWRQVHAMLLEAARRTVDIVPTPDPIVRQTALSDFYVEYRLAAYTPAATPVLRVDVLSRLHGNIQDVFNENGVQIMSPHYMADPADPQVVPKDRWHASPAKPG